MFKGYYVTEMSINDVKKYYDKLRDKISLTEEERSDFNICKERLIMFACEIITNQTLINEKVNKTKIPPKKDIELAPMQNKIQKGE